MGGRTLPALLFWLAVGGLSRSGDSLYFADADIHFDKLLAPLGRRSSEVLIMGHRGAEVTVQTLQDDRD